MEGVMDTNNTDKIAILIKKAALEAEKAQMPILQSCDLSVAQYKILKYLYGASPDTVRIVDLEAYYSMTHPAVIDILKVLEKKGYTRRIVNPEDARSKIVSLTEKAYAQRRELEALGDQMETAVTRNLSPAEKVELASLLHRMMGEQV